MAALVGDTHAVLWYIFSDPRLSASAAGAMDAATAEGDPIYVPSICLVEATYLIEKGRVPPVALERLTSALHYPRAGFRSAPLDLDVAFHVRDIPRELVRICRIAFISATALALKLPLVTRDGRIRAAGIQTIW